MKRIISLSIVALVTLTIAAQQRIYTTSGETLHGYVAYTTDDFFYFSQDEDLTTLDSIPAKDVYNVVYKNGSFDIITRPEQTQDKGSILSKPLAKIDYDGRKIVSYGGKSISESEWLALAARANADDLYAKGKTLRGVGLPLWASGLGFAAVGAIAMLAGAQNENRKVFVAGEVLAIFGAPLVVVGIPLHCVGNSLQEKSYKTFNAL